ncbi:MAG: heme-binding protein [Myxococcales bacterium]|nr:heme-binding protein [Myxococcales bacterium]
MQMHDGPLEIRRYAPRVVATVKTVGDRDAASRAGFKRLARYIFGGNDQGNKVAMTAPVSATPSGDIAGDDPGFADRMGATDSWQVMFTMPSAWTLNTLPVPLDEGVQLMRRPGACYAAHVFTGLTTDQTVRERTQQLVTWLERRDLQPSGEPTLARYNTPWTLPWRRRNEILIPLTHATCSNQSRSR